MFAEVGEVSLGEINVEVFGVEFDAHQEESGFLVGMLVSVKDVAAVAVDEISDGGDFAFTVRAGDEEDGGGFHERSTRTALRAVTTSSQPEMFGGRRKKSSCFGVLPVEPYHCSRTPI
jgi:hypothetical protein